jgi:glycosyltransferase involved in cell wall biosynthesis
VGSVAALSIVVPAFNEAEVIEQLVLDVERELLSLFPDLELIVVDDCSTDGTAAILDGLAASRAWLRVVHAERNSGHGPSVVKGLSLASADWIFQIDSDGQFVVAELSRLWERRDEADLVLGLRLVRNDPTHRLLLTRLVRLTVSLLVGHRLRDPNVPFRLVRRTLWEELAPLIGPSTLAPSILVVVGAVARGRRVVEVPVTHLARERGASTLSSWRRLTAFSLRGLVELVRFRLRLRRAGQA